MPFERRNCKLHIVVGCVGHTMQRKQLKEDSESFQITATCSNSQPKDRL